MVVRFNNRPLPASPGLLKRRRVTEDTEEGGESSRPRKRRRTDGGEDEPSFERRKRIKWVEKDSTGASIDPQFSEEERESSEAANSGGLDSCEEIDAYGYAGHPVSEIADSPGEGDGGGAIENLDLLGRDNATLAEDLVFKEQLEWRCSEEVSQVGGRKIGKEKKLFLSSFLIIYCRPNHSLHSFEVHPKLMGKNLQV